jgi:hypothetical protein
MKQTKTYCDLCGAEIKKGYGVDKGNLKFVGRKKGNTTHMSWINWDDLCHNCSAELFNLLYKFQEAKRK